MHGRSELHIFFKNIGKEK